MGNKNYEVITECVAIKDEYMYCVAREMNIILKINKESLQVEIMTNMPDEDGMVSRLYFGIYIDGDEMMLVPCNAKKLWIYNFVTCTWKGLALDDFVDPNMEAKFVGGALKNGMAYLYGFKYKGILKVNVKSGEITELLEKQGEYAFWGESTAELDNKLYVANRLESNVMCIDTYNAKIKKIFIDECKQRDKYKNDGIVNVGDTFYIMSHHGNYFIKWNSREETQIIEIDKIFDTMESYFNGIAASKDIVFLYGSKKKNFIYNINSPNNSYVLDGNIYFAKYYENIGFVVCKKGKINIYDSQYILLNIIDININNSKHDMIMKKNKIESKVYKENDFVRLNEFVKLFEEN